MDPATMQNLFLYGGNPAGTANPNPTDGSMMQDPAAAAQQQQQQQQQQQIQQQQQQQQQPQQQPQPQQQQQLQQQQQQQQDAQQQMAQAQAFAGMPSLLQAYLVQQQQLQQQQQHQQQAAAAAMADRRLSGLATPAGISLAASTGAGGGFPGFAGMQAAAFFPQAFNPGNPGNFTADYVDTNRLFLQRLQGAGATAAAGGGQANNNWIGDMSGAGDPYAENGILGPWSATSAGLLGKMAVVNQDKAKKIRRKPKDKPKRPLSAYNIFFKEERARILEEIPEGDGKSDGTAGAGGTGKGKKKRKKTPHGKIGFESLAKVIGQRWQELTPDQVEYYKEKASDDMKRYKDEMELYLAKQDGPKKEAGGAVESTLPEFKEVDNDAAEDDEDHFDGHDDEDDDESAVKKVKLEETAV